MDPKKKLKKEQQIIKQVAKTHVREQYEKPCQKPIAEKPKKMMAVRTNGRNGRSARQPETDTLVTLVNSECDWSKGVRFTRGISEEK